MNRGGFRIETPTPEPGSPVCREAVPAPMVCAGCGSEQSLCTAGPVHVHSCVVCLRADLLRKRWTT